MDTDTPTLGELRRVLRDGVPDRGISYGTFWENTTTGRTIPWNTITISREDCERVAGGEFDELQASTPLNSLFELEITALDLTDEEESE